MRWWEMVPIPVVLHSSLMTDDNWCDEHVPNDQEATSSVSWLPHYAA
jgi:hypothetical protein